jgi:hypothetical protein
MTRYYRGVYLPDQEDLPYHENGDNKTENGLSSPFHTEIPTISKITGLYSVVIT